MKIYLNLKWKKLLRYLWCDRGLSFIFLVIFFSIGSYAGSINSNGTYEGKVRGVAIGFWGHVGVGLDGVQCEGKNEVLLLSSNEKYKDILSVLLAAEASGKSVMFYKVNATTE